MVKILLFQLVLFFANTVQAITGFAGTVLAMPPSTYLLGLDNAKVVLNAMAWVSGLMIAIMNYRYINWKELAKIVVFMIAGMFAGMEICRVINSDSTLLTIYGFVILAIALKNLLVKKETDLPQAALYLVLLAAGVIHGMFVSGGALLVIYAVQVLKDKNEFRATVAPVWVVLNTFMMITRYRSGLFTTENVQLIAVSILPLFLATWLGGKLAQRLNQNVFLNLTYILLIISGVSLVF